MSECTVVHIGPTDVAKAGNAEGLRVRLKAAAGAQPYAEIWITHAPFPSLCGLISRQLGWLLLLRYEGDAGFSSRNSNGASGDITYVLGNGQVDQYPAAWAHPVDVILDALVEFAHTKRAPGCVQWHNDSGVTGHADP